MQVRNAQIPQDYAAIVRLYTTPNSFGGQFDTARDSQEKLEALVKAKPHAILVAEDKGKIVGTVTLFENGRSAWLYRFAVQDEQAQEITAALTTRATEILKQLGHTQVLVYARANNKQFEQRYLSQGFSKGNDYTAYWKDI